jgi:hypothetical protein
MGFFKPQPERIIKLPMWIVVFKRKNMILTRRCESRKEANAEKKKIQETDNLEFVEIKQQKVLKPKKKK